MGRNYEIWAVEVDGQQDIPLVQGLSLADEPRFSPDGRWVAFHAVERDAPQVFVMPFPPTGERWQLSASGGVQPRWRADGRELFFLSPDGRMMSVTIPAGGPKEAPRPTLLFDSGLTGSAAFDQFAPAPTVSVSCCAGPSAPRRATRRRSPSSSTGATCRRCGRGSRAWDNRGPCPEASRSHRKLRRAEQRAAEPGSLLRAPHEVSR